MKKISILLALLVFSAGVFAQQSLLVFLEASEKKPFYIKIGSKVNVSTSNGQVYITELSESSFDIFIGFPETDIPEQRFLVSLKKNDNSFQLKQAGQGWSLIDLENDKVILPAPIVSTASRPLGGVRKTDAFSIMMAGVVNDTSVLYTSVISNPIETQNPVNPPVADDLRSQEKPRSTALVDSTGVKQVDSSVAVQQTEADKQTNEESLRQSQEMAANNSSAREKDSLAEALRIEAVKAGDSAAKAKSALAKKEGADREVIVKDSLDKIALETAALKGAAEKDAAAKDAAAKDAAAKDAAAKDAAIVTVIPVDAAETASKQAAATKDSMTRLNTSNAAARAEFEKDSLANAVAFKDSLVRDAIAKQAARDSLAKETAAKEALAKETAAKEALAKEALAKETAAKEALAIEMAAKETAAKETAARETAVRETAAKETAAKNAVDKENATKAALQTNSSSVSGVSKISEKKTDKTFTIQYAVKDGKSKTDTIEIIIPVAPPTTVVPTKDSIFPRWQSNPRPLTDPPVVAKKDTPSTSDPAYTQPATKGAVMVNSDCVNFATEYDVDKLRVKMLAEVTAEDRIAAAKKVFRTKCFTSRQIRALTELFLNDEGKYKFLDTAYPFASDSQEFRKLVSVLKEDYFIKRFNAMIRG